MSTRYNPSIIRDSFALYVDAANTKSYPGSGTAWKDISGKGNDGTLTNGPTFSSDYGGKFNFDNTNDYVDCGNVLNQTAYTKSAWFRPESVTRNIISGNTNTHAFWMANTNNTLASGHQGQWSRVSYTVPSGNMLNQWWNGTVTWNDSTGWVLYLNGVQVDTNSNTTGPNGDQTFIGKYHTGYHFDGDIAQVMIYDRVLTATEVLQNYNAFKGRFGL